MRLLMGLLAGLILSQPLSGCAPGTERVGPDGQTSPREKTSAGGKEVLNIAHRGASGRAPENTFVAYELALESGADYIEQDVRLTRDGVPVVLHDRTLNRTAKGPEPDCTGPVVQRRLDQIKTCEVGSWFNEAYPDQARESYERLEVPTLEEVLSRYRDRANFYLDIKAGASSLTDEELEELLGLVGEYGLLGTDSAGNRRAIAVSSRRDTLQRLNTRAPALTLTRSYPASATGTGIEEPLQTLQTVPGYAAGINPPEAETSPGLIEAAHERGLGVYPYVVNDRARMEELIGAGVDGMFTAFPSRLDRATEGEPASMRRP